MRVPIREVADRAGVSPMTVSRVINESPRLCNTQADLERERGDLEDMLAFQVDGLLIAPVSDRSRPNRRALARNKVPVVLVDRSISGFECDLVHGDSLLELPEPPTAIFAVNVVALGVTEAARAAGLEIPRDLALVCFDDIEHASRLSPFLTVMAQPAETFGTIATQLLLDRLGGRVGERRRIVVLPDDFPVRESCGARAASAEPVPVAG